MGYIYRLFSNEYIDYIVIGNVIYLNEYITEEGLKSLHYLIWEDDDI